MLAIALNLLLGYSGQISLGHAGFFGLGAYLSGIMTTTCSVNPLVAMPVEQNAKAALKLADRGYVLETGKVILEGPADELMENAEVKRAYLGKDKKEMWER